MSIEIKVPVLPESVADATIATWRKKTGDPVKMDENLVDIETDKVVLEVVATSAGVLGEILKPAGSKVMGQEVIGWLLEAGAVSLPIPSVNKAMSSVASKVTAEAKQEIMSAVITKEPIIDPSLSPAARRAMAEAEVNTKVAKSKFNNTNVVSVVNMTGNRTEARVPMTRLRARVAERLLSAQQNAAILTTFNEVNMQPVMDLRVEYKEKFEKKHGAKLGFMSFFVKACSEALKEFTSVNASIDGQDIIYHSYCDIGIAIASERGLVVPILRNAENMSMAQIETSIVEFGKKAQDGKLTLEEMNGGTFTISNGGVFGSLLSTPIINPPQTAILGMHKIEDRPVVEKGVIVIRPMMYMALSYDHRLIDGSESVRFLVKIKEYLEDPARLILNI